MSVDAVAPPSVDIASFDDATYKKATLEVTEESIYAYKTHPVWSKFSNLSSVEDVVADESTVTVFNLSGVLLYENAEPAVVDGLEPGFYIIRQGSVPRKIAVKVGPML